MPATVGSVLVIQAFGLVAALIFVATAVRAEEPRLVLVFLFAGAVQTVIIWGLATAQS
jgi:hypothetical protein